LMDFDIARWLCLFRDLMHELGLEQYMLWVEM
jgi:hypothetical protein